MKWRFSRQHYPLAVTTAVFLLVYLAGGLKFPAFFSAAVLLNLFADNAFLGLAAVGMTFVILSGGIDLSVGAVIGCVSILTATLIERANWPPLLVMPVMLLGGTLFGAGLGSLICFFELPPFLVTLAGLFFCRGLGLLISQESISINHEILRTASSWGLSLGEGGSLRLAALIFILVLGVAIYISVFTRFGRNVYAIGGSESSAQLMGLPVGSTKVAVYAVSGFCSALAGIVYTISLSSGNATAASGLELDAIAAVVVGGTLLGGGAGYVAGTLIGVLIFGIIGTAIDFQGTLSTWWTKITVGLLLLIFIALQKVLQKGVRGKQGQP